MAKVADPTDRKQPEIVSLKQARRWVQSADMQLRMGCEHPDWPAPEQVERARESLDRADNILRRLAETT